MLIVKKYIPKENLKAVWEGKTKTHSPQYGCFHIHKFGKQDYTLSPSATQPTTHFWFLLVFAFTMYNEVQVYIKNT